MMVCLVAMLFLSIFCFAGYSYWDYHREKATFFADYVDEFGIPRGIFPLTEREIAGRSGHYRFVSSHGKLRRVIHANSAGFPTPITHTEFQDRPIVQVFFYNEAGRLTRTEYLDRNDRLQIQRDYFGVRHTIIDFELRDEDTGLGDVWLPSRTTAITQGLFDMTGNVDSTRR